ncbi:hypothetical protein [Shewanella sp. OMA3-2]|nr:hypothetical protein [Shewanella sp. OMA3-2]UJF23011.1 hypothetical protein L0B17_06540 [Shewanella sp. OMA3-2]
MSLIHAGGELCIDGGMMHLLSLNVLTILSFLKLARPYFGEHNAVIR